MAVYQAETRCGDQENRFWVSWLEYTKTCHSLLKLNTEKFLLSMARWCNIKICLKGRGHGWYLKILQCACKMRILLEMVAKQRRSQAFVIYQGKALRNEVVRKMLVCSCSHILTNARMFGS